MIWVEVGEAVVGIALVAISAGVMIIVAGMEATSSQVEQKAVALLQPWLSPEQAEQYSSYRYFEVIGSDTGKRYRIRHDSVAAGVNPRCSGTVPAHDGGVAVGGQRDGPALLRGTHVGADQLASLLGPHTVAAGVHPRCSAEPRVALNIKIKAVGRPAHDGGVAVGGQRDGANL
jgi:hypothetical protein